MRPSRHRMAWLPIAIVGALWAFGPEPAHPQGVGSSTGLVQGLLQGLGGTGQSGLGLGDINQPQPAVELYQPVIPQLAQFAPPSRLEALYGSRAGRPLTQFGYDILGVPTAVTSAQIGGVQDNYILNEGDELIVDLRGQDSVSYRQRIDRDGRIILPKLNPIPAAGAHLLPSGPIWKDKLLKRIFLRLFSSQWDRSVKFLSLSQARYELQERGFLAAWRRR